MMEYRKVGRGGAGNYYSKKDIDELSKRVAEVLPLIYYLFKGSHNVAKGSRISEARK